MIDYTGSYSVSWRLMSVDPLTWEDSAELADVTAAAVTKDATDDYPLLEAGTFSCDKSAGEVFDTGWYRLEALITDDSGEVRREPIATLLCESSESVYDHGYDALSIDAYSVLKPATDKKMVAGDYVPLGVDGAEYVRALLAECTPAPVSATGSFTIDDYIVFEAGYSYLRVCWTILDSAGWCIMIDGYGAIHICEKPSEPVFTYDASNADFLFPNITKRISYTNVPNRYIAIDPASGEVAVAENDWLDSPTSTYARGRYIEEVDTNPVRINGETLQGYADRMLESESTVMETRRYETEYRPEVVPFSLVRFALPEHGLEGDMRVMSQSISCSSDIHVNEQAAKEVVTWRA